MPDRFELTLKNREEELLDALHELDLFLDQHVLSMHQRNAMRLVFEELAMNVVCHQKAPCTLSLCVELSGPFPRMIFKDNGTAFDPAHHAASPGLRRPLEQRVEGALGLHLVQGLAMDLNYERCDGENVTRIQFDPRGNDCEIA